MATNNWNGEGRASAPDAVFDRGYDVKTSAAQANENGANAFLSDDGDNTHIKLTITSIQTTFALAGSEGQSQMQKDFYPRNFQSPSFSITCQTRSQKEVGRIAEFVHKAQRHAVSQGSLMKLIVPASGLKNTAATTTSQGMRGTRKGMQMTGYVKNVPRTHNRFIQAPSIGFDFVVYRMESGLYLDQPYKVYKLAKWSEIVDSVMSQNFIGARETVASKEARESSELKKANEKAVANEFIAVADWLGDITG